eukprot:6376805-Pyramimonas_sp.AAC.1
MQQCGHGALNDVAEATKAQRAIPNYSRRPNYPHSRERQIGRQADVRSDYAPDIRPMPDLTTA